MHIFATNKTKMIMKKVLLLLFVFSLAFHVQGQVSVTIGDVERGEGTIFVPVEADFSSGICAFDLFVNFDEAVLEFTGIANVAALPGDDIQFNTVTPSQAKISWFDLTDDGTTFAGKLFYLGFTNHGGDSDIDFDADTEFGDCDGLALPPGDVTLTGGSVTTVPVPLGRWALIIGAGLIVLFVVLRATRVI